MLKLINWLIINQMEINFESVPIEIWIKISDYMDDYAINLALLNKDFLK